MATRRSFVPLVAVLAGFAAASCTRDDDAMAWVGKRRLEVPQRIADDEDVGLRLAAHHRAHVADHRHEARRRLERRAVRPRRGSRRGGCSRRRWRGSP